MQIKNPVMVLIPTKEYEKLTTIGYDNMKPIIKLFQANLTWLVTCIDGGILYGYADLGMGCVEWGSLCMENELATMKIGPFWLERDRHWQPKEGDKYLEMDSLSGI